MGLKRGEEGEDGSKDEEGRESSDLRRDYGFGLGT